MKKNLYRLGLICISILTLVACSDNIVDGIHVKPESNNDEDHYSLVIHLNNIPDSQEEVIVGVLAKNPFAENSSMGDNAFIVSQKVENNKVHFSDLKDYYKEQLFFNVYEKKGESYTILTHLGNQLEYQVTFGDVEKTIDLNAKKPDIIRLTDISVVVDQAYLKKRIYLVKSDQQTLFEKTLQEGGELTADLYVTQTESTENETKMTIHSPRIKGQYFVYLLSPEEGIMHLKRNLSIEYSTETVSVDFQREQQKVISVNVVRGEEPMIDAEVYLILKSNWSRVQDQVAIHHGSPEPGTFVAKHIACEGKTSFAVFCTEGEQEYVIYVPKWNSDYYDSFQKRELTIKQETINYLVDVEAPYTPNGNVQKRKVTFNISVRSSTSNLILNPYASYAYVLNDATQIQSAWSAICGGSGSSFEGLTQSGDVVSGYDTKVIIKDVEVDLSKEIAVIVTGKMSNNMYMFVPGVKRINGSEINGNSIDVVIENIESLKSNESL